ncbi:DUF4925 domain-containing protein [Parabacteroides goldsteinii]|uniref:DUF4925 domain-containing protein n=1 Tax=Parabacteroides goldsteinii TaxID=328812 RepID=UPI0034A51488
MSKKLVYLFALICSIGLFTGCSDDEEEIVDNSWEELVGDYSGENLVLSYGDMALTGKKVSFSATSGNNGKLLLNNIIPGENETTISNVEVKNSEFSGTATTTYANVEYAGSVKEKVMTLKLTVVMNDPNGWAKTYSLADYTTGPLEYNGYENPNAVLAGAGYINYVCVTSSSDYGTSYGAIFRGVFGILLPQVLNSITLGTDGTITAKYIKEGKIEFKTDWIFQSPTKEVVEALIPTSNWLDAPKHLAYWFHKDGKLYMKLDLGNIIGQVMGSNADGMSDIITAVLTSEPAQLKQLLAGLLKVSEIPVSDETIALLQNWAVNGIPMSTKTENGHTYIYLDKNAFDPIMKMRDGSSDLLNLWNMLSTAGIIPPDAALAGLLLHPISGNWDVTEAFDLGLDLKAN